VNSVNNQMNMRVLDSDDESLAEYMGGLSSDNVSGDKKRPTPAVSKVSPDSLSRISYIIINHANL